MWMSETEWSPSVGKMKWNKKRLKDRVKRMLRRQFFIQHSLVLTAKRLRMHTILYGFRFELIGVSFAFGAFSISNWNFIAFFRSFRVFFNSFYCQSEKSWLIFMIEFIGANQIEMWFEKERTIIETKRKKRRKKSLFCVSFIGFDDLKIELFFMTTFVSQQVQRKFSFRRTTLWHGLFKEIHLSCVCVFVFVNFCLTKSFLIVIFPLNRRLIKSVFARSGKTFDSLYVVSFLLNLPPFMFALRTTILLFASTDFFYRITPPHNWCAMAAISCESMRRCVHRMLLYFNVFSWIFSSSASSFVLHHNIFFQFFFIHFCARAHSSALHPFDVERI